MKTYFLTIAVGIVFISILFIACGGEQTGGTNEPVTLRSESATLNLAEIQQMVKDKGLNSPGDNIKGSFKNNFEQANLRGVDVINDHKTNLMWQQEENSDQLSWKEAEAYVLKMNQEKMAGFSDWRLPTAEELLSLMRSGKKGDCYIDPVFSAQILSTWTSDIVTDAFAGAWFVDFWEGKAVDGNRAAGLGHVRLVRILGA